MGYYDPTPETIEMMKGMSDDMIRYCTKEAVIMYRRHPEDATYSEWLESIVHEEKHKAEH